MTSPDLLPSFEIHYGLPHPCWKRFTPRVESLADPGAQENSWRLAAEAWLTKLARALSDDTTVFASERVLLVGSPAAESLTMFAEKTILYIDRLLKGIGSTERRGPHVIIVFEKTERFFDYVDYYHREDGAYSGSTAMFLSNTGYPHIVVGSGQTFRRSSIAHELTHDYLASRELPLWIEEGLAQLVEQHAVGTQRSFLNREQKQRHYDQWSRSGLDLFWSGEAFSMPDEISELAYELALTFVRNIISDAGDKAAEFVRQANYADAGETAAQQVLGCSIGDFVEDFLGPKR